MQKEFPVYILYVSFKKISSAQKRVPPGARRSIGPAPALNIIHSGRFKTRPRRSKTPPRRSKTLQDEPKTLQDAPKTPQEAPKTRPRRLKTPPRCDFGRFWDPKWSYVEPSWCKNPMRKRSYVKIAWKPKKYYFPNIF